ncbi:MAG: phosphoribosylformylglycinamidine cyclo-ligase [Candidatus Altiarchaeales archaeon]|nr:MAG: phosphoribosylformylglycinamidine cyclo-ligase [Candidatus Altiarchaeales archaeon]
MPEEMTYAKAGVSIEREELAIRKIRGIIEKTSRFRKGKVGEVMQGIGSYANLIDMGSFALAICMDGIGSKILVAQELDKYDTVGIDLVAMNVNDLICIGAEPIAMVDYIAVKHIHPEIVREICIGIYEGAKEADVAVVGGETATLPEIITGIDEKGFDLAGTAVGIVNKDKVILGEKIKVGDVVLGFKSSGIHSNGLTLARKVLPRNMWIDLLTPTRIYVKEILELINNYDVHGLAHITGGGVRNLLRITDLGFYLDNMPKPQMIFRKIQEEGNVSDKEMYRTFNMGVGFCSIVDEKDSEDVIKRFGDEWKIRKIGRVVEEPGVRIVKDGKEMIIR